MKIINAEKLVEHLDADLAWRKKELTYIVNNVKSAPENSINSNLRIGIAILYAHWEGYIKNASIYYLNFIRHKRLNYENLKPNFIAIALRSQLNECGRTNKSSIHTKIVEFFIQDLSKVAEIPDKNIINTQSNLNLEVFKEILFTLGLDYSIYELKENFIDYKLLKIRNDVAHGDYIEIDKEDFLNLYTYIMNIIESFKEQIINAAENEKFKRNIT